MSERWLYHDYITDYVSMVCTTSLNKPNTMLIFPDCLSGLALGRLAGLIGRHPWNCQPFCGLGAGSGALGDLELFGVQGSIRFVFPGSVVCVQDAAHSRGASRVLWMGDFTRCVPRKTMSTFEFRVCCWARLWKKSVSWRIFVVCLHNQRKKQRFAHQI